MAKKQDKDKIEGTIRAIIDIGTNSVKLLVAAVHRNSVSPLFEKSEQTRLGQGFYETRKLEPEAIQHTAEAVEGFVQLAAAFEPVSIHAIATSAAREAKNAHLLLAAIEKASGLRPQVISGEQEGIWIFRGVTSDPRFARRPLLVTDIGGGSTEYIVGQGQDVHFCQSFAIGALRLLEKIRPSDPPKPTEFEACRHEMQVFFKKHIYPGLRPALDKIGAQKCRFVGTGGTATIFARMHLQLKSFEREKMEGLELTVRDLKHYMNLLWSLPVTERREIKGLPGKRADVILAGSVILYTAMEQLGFESFYVSTRGLRYAAVINPTLPDSAPTD